jgi:hypothetical protein
MKFSLISAVSCLLDPNILLSTKISVTLAYVKFENKLYRSVRIHKPMGKALFSVLITENDKWNDPLQRNKNGIRKGKVKVKMSL